MKIALALAFMFLSSLAHAQWMGAVILHDGNYHDKDDWGAIAMSLCWGQGKAGLLGCIVNDHYPQSLPGYEAQMLKSVDEGCALFGHNRSLFFSHSVGNLPQMINASSPQRRLLVILGSPAEVLWQAKQKSNPAQWKNVSVLTHSSWNDSHKHPGTHNLADCKPAHTIRIHDQNRNLRTDYSRWQWMRRSPGTSWVLDRALATGKAQADFSDFGMVAYAVTGDQNYTPEKLRRDFGL